MDADDQPKVDKLAIALRIGVYLFLAFAGTVIFPRLMLWSPNMIFVAAALGVFAAAAVANAVALRIYERGQLADIGMGWTAASRRNLLIGIIAGSGAAATSILLPVVLRAADLERIPGGTFQWGSVLFVSVVLLFGAIGEEMLFRGYAFQVLLGYLGPFATILPVCRPVRVCAHGQSWPGRTHCGLRRTDQHDALGNASWIRIRAQRRSVAAHRTPFRLELAVAPAGREPQRIYNGGDGDRVPFAGKRHVDWRRLRA